MSDDQERGRALKRKAVPSPRTSTSKDRKSQKTYDADEYAIRDIGPVPDPDETSPFPDFSEEEAAKHTVAEYEMRVSTPDRLPGQGDQPFTRGVIEPLLHEASAERKKRNFMKPARGTDPRFRLLQNMTSGSPNASGVKLESPAFIKGSEPGRPNFLLPNGVPLAQTMGNFQTHYGKPSNLSNSSNASVNHSSKASSSASSMIKPEHENAFRMSTDFNSINMHISEASYASHHLRAARDIISDSTASSGSLPYPAPYPAMPEYAPGSRPSTAGGDSYPPPSSYQKGGYGSTQYAGNNAGVWNSTAPGASYGNAFSQGVHSYPAHGQPQYGAHPYAAPEPPTVYRASTYHPTTTRASVVPMQRGSTYGGPLTYGQDASAVTAYPQYGAVGSRLNANAAEFSHRPGSAGQTFNPSHLGKHVYIHPAQQINWRQLLEPGVTADWDLIVDKIISSNDQQASIFLQQKIKNSEPTLKDAIIDSIIGRGLELMGNRFGNFLIQRVFECANHNQIMGLAAHIENHTVRLSTDAFGCHVIQKAFDCVPESFKHQMVRELLTRIRDTIVHRYACHVWQKLFELRWQGPPPMIMGTVNAALVGQWTQVAVGETGSLVVQNIFENCNEDDKRPCINEVLANLDYIARGQYGNWCIQHVCEHGEADDRDAAIALVLNRAADYSMDQYASKCIEKCLKVCGNDFLDRYLQQVLMRGPGETFSPLVQIARDQYGNFLIQWILNNANPHLRDIVQAEIRKHLVSLRGNKYGSKVALTCGYGPQGVRPGVPFAAAGHRHHNGPRGPPQFQAMSTHSAGYNMQYQYAQMDGAPPAQYNVAPNYGPPPPRGAYIGPYGGPNGPYPQY